MCMYGGAQSQLRGHCLKLIIAITGRRLPVVGCQLDWQRNSTQEERRARRQRPMPESPCASFWLSSPALRSAHGKIASQQSGATSAHEIPQTVIWPPKGTLMLEGAALQSATIENCTIRLQAGTSGDCVSQKPGLSQKISDC